MTTMNDKEEKIKKYKVQLDHRTVITVKGLEKLQFWMKKYPKLQVIGT